MKRREFIKSAALSTAAITMGGVLQKGCGGRTAKEASSSNAAALPQRPYGKTGGRATREEVPLPASKLDPSILQYRSFFEAVQGMRPPFPSARDHLPAVLIARASLLSQAEGRHIKAAEVT